MVMYGHVWSCKIMYGPVWSCMVTHMITYGVPNMPKKDLLFWTLLNFLKKYCNAEYKAAAQMLNQSFMHLDKWIKYFF